MVKTTKVFKSNPASNSLRTTIPDSIVELLDLHNNDDLEWKTQPINGEILVFIRKPKLTPEAEVEEDMKTLEPDQQTPVNPLENKGPEDDDPV
ncbi:MAG: hypothetical protein ABSA11_04670 [Candidatus Bathyarchaeia archaeon]|jgi:antitoxin component of MazEF toxin-antitoxin module